MIISCKNRRNRWGKIAYNKSSLHASREEKAIRGNSGCGGGGGVQEPPMLLNPKCFTITKA